MLPADLSAIEISAATSLRPHPKWTRQNAKAPSHEGQIAERRDVVAQIQKAEPESFKRSAEVARIGNMLIFIFRMLELSIEGLRCMRKDRVYALRVR